MKRADLEKSKGKKIDGSMSRTGTPARFGRASAAVSDRREQRKRDQALGLVPFAVKLDAGLVRQLHDLARDRGAMLSDVVGELLQAGLKGK